MPTPVIAVARTPLVAVYGTLKRGLRNHHWLDGAGFLGSDRLHHITLYDLGPFPGAVVEPTTYGLAWLYLYNPKIYGHTAIREGGWQPRG